jgi:hypothetical protein
MGSYLRLDFQVRTYQPRCRLRCEQRRRLQLEYIAMLGFPYEDLEASLAMNVDSSLGLFGLGLRYCSCD